MPNGREKPSVSPETCLNFVKFRMSLARSRSTYDDRIIQSINQLPDISNYTNLAKNQRKIQAQRVCDIEFCVRVLKVERDRLEGDDNGKIRMFEKEISLLESELMVESIMRDRTEEVISTKCTQLNNILVSQISQS